MIPLALQPGPADLLRRNAGAVVQARENTKPKQAGTTAVLSRQVQMHFPLTMQSISDI